MAGYSGLFCSRWMRAARWAAQTRLNLGCRSVRAGDGLWIGLGTPLACIIATALGWLESPFPPWAGWTTLAATILGCVVGALGGDDLQKQEAVLRCRWIDERRCWLDERDLDPRFLAALAADRRLVEME